MKQAVLTKTLAGSYTAFTFTHAGRDFFVKNFTAGDILVSFNNSGSDDKAYKIGAGYGEEITIPLALKAKSKTIYVKGTGDVQVEQLDGWEV